MDLYLSKQAKHRDWIIRRKNSAKQKGKTPFQPRKNMQKKGGEYQ